jgi:V/A-type H+/Na+-transporting ATPase subunit D
MTKVTTMRELRRVPPGRAGRLWLASRLQAAERAADLLDRELRVLLIDQERFRLLEERTRAEWRASWQAADVWILRAAAFGGERDVRLSSPLEPADVTISWASVMGLRYPVDAICEVPELTASRRGPGSAALVEATAAYREAIRAAVAHAAADSARHVIQAEIAATRRRLRAITGRRIPMLENALRALLRELDESERAENFRLRWAASGGRGSPMAAGQR